MKAHHKRIAVLAVAAAILMQVIFSVAYQVVYTVAVLNWAQSRGVFETPQQGVIANANRYYCSIDRVEIDHASTNSFDGSNPHIWYVIYTVYADSHIPCDLKNTGEPLYHETFERGGNFYLNVHDGWVMMPEGRFPELIGFWMKVLNLAGPGDPFHIPREW